MPENNNYLDDFSEERVKALLGQIDNHFKNKGIDYDKKNAEVSYAQEKKSLTDALKSSYISFNDLAKEIYQNNVDKGFYEEPRTFGDRIALMHSELSEALEADRKDLMDDKLTHRKGIEVELADCLIRILDCSAFMGLDIHGAVMEKLAYNKTRPYKHGKKY